MDRLVGLGVGRIERLVGLGVGGGIGLFKVLVSKAETENENHTKISPVRWRRNVLRVDIDDNTILASVSIRRIGRH